MKVDALARRDLRERVNAASQTSGVPARHLEKDYWVTQVLRALSRDLDGRWVFKGGTSLSKAYSLIERFSEDIDLLLVDVAEGEATDELIEQIAQVGTSAVRDGTFTYRRQVAGFAAIVKISYPIDATKARGVERGIQLEPGIRGGPRPTERVAIQPLIAQLAPEIAGTSSCMNSFEVTVLHPGRTLIEKLSAVHHKAVALQGDADMGVGHRFARHFYDIDRLLIPGSPAYEVLNDQATFGAIAADCSATSRRWFGAEEDQPTNFADSPAFTDASLTSRLRPAYDEACDDLCYPGAARSSWADVAATVTGNRRLLGPTH